MQGVVDVYCRFALLSNLERVKFIRLARDAR